jgi:16S rRNA processing protein RimM
VSGDFLAIGRLGAPKGVRGDLKIHSYSGESAHIFRLREAELRGTDPATGGPRKLKLKIARIEGEGEALTIAFEGYPSPETARALTGMDIIVPRSEAAPLKPNEWYIVDLVGLSLVHGGQKLATVRSVLEGGPDPWLEAVITKPDSGSVPGVAKRDAERVALVPFRKEFVGKVDIEAGTIELLALELLDE